jgi:hypothetical protein
MYVPAVFSALLAVESLSRFVSQEGTIEGTLSWLVVTLVTSFVSDLIAEILESSILTPFSWIAS